MNEPRACDRSAGSLISSGPSSLGALINLARESGGRCRLVFPHRTSRRTDACGAGCLKIYRDTQKEQATTRFLCMRARRDAALLSYGRHTCNIQPPAAEYLNTAGILRGIKIYLLPAPLYAAASPLHTNTRDSPCPKRPIGPNLQTSVVSRKPKLL